MASKIALSLLFACVAAQAADAQTTTQGGNALTSPGGLLVQRILAENAREFATIPRSSNIDGRATPLSLAIASAAKKDFIEAGIEESRRALIECQKETSVVLVMPSLRSDSQQAHCFRY